MVQIKSGIIHSHLGKFSKQALDIAIGSIFWQSFGALLSFVWIFKADARLSKEGYIWPSIWVKGEGGYSHLDGFSKQAYELSTRAFLGRAFGKRG